MTERLSALAPYEDLFDLSAMEAVCRLHRATSYLGKAFRSASSDDELEISEIHLLLALSLNGVGRKVSPRQLAEISLMSPATVSVGVSRLEKLGFIVREPDLDDQRTFIVHLTATGKKAVSKQLHALSDFAQKFFEGVTKDELHRLSGLLKLILVNHGDTCSSQRRNAGTDDAVSDVARTSTRSRQGAGKVRTSHLQVVQASASVPTSNN